MIGGVVRHKTVAAGTLLEQQAYIRVKARILAGTQALKRFFKNTRAHHIGYSDGAYKTQAPPPAFATIIERDKYQDKKIQRHPEHRVAEVRQHGIKHRVGEAAVQLNKQPFIPLL